MSAPARRIVMLARSYRLLARRVELLAHDRDQRLTQALAQDALGPLHLLDAATITTASEIDLMCGYAVSVISERAPSSQLLDVLGILNPERVAALYWALPPSRRRHLMSDPTCAYHVCQYRDDLPQAEAELEALIDATPMTPFTRDLAEFTLAGEA